MEALLINEKLLYVQYHLPGGVSQELKVVAGRQPAVLGWVRRLFLARLVQYIHIYKLATHRSLPLADLGQCGAEGYRHAQRCTPCVLDMP